MVRPSSSLEERRPDRLERRGRRRLQAGQHVEDVIEVPEAPTGAHLVEVGPGREDVDDLLASAEVLGHGGQRRDRRLEARALARAWPLPEEGVEHEGDAREVLLLVLPDDGPAQAGPGPPVDLAQGVAVAVLAGPDELERVADHGREGDAARLVAAAHRQGQRVERVVARVGEDHLLRQPDGLRPDEPKEVGPGDADTGQDVAAAPPWAEVDPDAGGAALFDIEGALPAGLRRTWTRREEARPRRATGALWRGHRARRRPGRPPPRAPPSGGDGSRPSSRTAGRPEKNRPRATRRGGAASAKRMKTSEPSGVHSHQGHADRGPQDEAAALRQPTAVEGPRGAQEIRPVERSGEEVRGHVRALRRLAGQAGTGTASRISRTTFSLETPV